jgi:hypothetical protein
MGKLRGNGEKFYERQGGKGADSDLEDGKTKGKRNMGTREMS